MGKLFELIRNHPQQVSALVAMCAVLLSFLSIILTVTALWLQRRHYFKSVTPIANIYFWDVENLVRVSLKNAGPGPLIIGHFLVSGGDMKATGNILDQLPDLNYSDFTTHLDGLCLTANEEINLVEFKGDVKDPDFVSSREKLRAKLSVLRLQISYKDIYDRQMRKKDSQSDLAEWFGRSEPDEEVPTPEKITPATAVGPKRQ